MAGSRSALPLRLQQILSGGRSSSPVLKLESETPPIVKAFIDRVIKSPLHDIAIPLSGFHWEYNKGNFHHWRPLFMHFDTYFKTYLSCRKDLILSDNILEDDPFPKHAILQILRVMQIILENCYNKSSFGGLEHFKLLLASTDPDILIATLETLSALVKISSSKIHLGGKLIGCGSISSHLLSLAQGWGSKEEGLGLYSCVLANERNQHEGLCLFPSDIGDKCDATQYRLGSTLHFEYSMVPSIASELSNEAHKSPNICVIKIPDLHLRKDDVLSILRQCVDQFNVPLEHRFSLLTRVRYANAFQSPRVCRLYTRISILAFIVLVQSNDAHDELTSFFANEPEYTNELIRLVHCEVSVPGTIRALAMLALGAQLAAYASSHERARILSGSSIISGNGNRMMLLNVLQKAIVSLSGNPSDPCTLVFVDALLRFFLLHVLSSSSSVNAIRGSGMVPTLLPLLQDSDLLHVHIVSSGVKTLHKLMEYSSTVASLFKDLGGIELLAYRLQIEVLRITGIGESNSNTVIANDVLKSDEHRLYLQKHLIKYLLRALGSSTYSPGNVTRNQNSHHNSLLDSLSLIFNNVDKFGGYIYFSAVTVMSEIIHKDPTCFSVLSEFGLPQSFLSSVVSGVLPSSKALVCIPNGLGAICLNAKGLEAVKETAALRFLVEAFTTRKYLVVMNEGVVHLANAVDELLRHVSSLRSIGVEIIIEIVKKLSSMREEKCKETTLDMYENTAMDTDLEEKSIEGHDLVNAMDLADDGFSVEQFVQLCIFHVMILVHRTMENPETCRMFVEKAGIETLLGLLQRPSLTQTSEGMPIALHSTVVFKGFTQHHSAALARAFCSSLREYLKKALNEFNSVSGLYFQDTKPSQDNEIYSFLSFIEFLLILAASKDNCWMSALLTEFGDTSKDVLEDIGRLHRQILWQISLLEDSKTERNDDLSRNEVQKGPAVVNSEEQRIVSSNQHLDTLLRRRMSSWSIESQVSDLISIYRDFGRVSSGSHRYAIDGYSTLQFASSSRPQSSNSLDINSTIQTEEDKQKSYQSLCHDMMRSLSYDISHLFVELGKAMLLTLRRETNPVTLSPSILSVISTFASIVLGHLNFGGHVGSFSESKVSVSAKCQYLGKVIGFVNGIILDKPDSSNPIMIKCFYGHGIIEAVLTTFEATSQLLFTVNRVPASPMDMDDKSHNEQKDEADNSWIYGPLACYGTLLDLLATSSFILSSSTKQLLEQPITNGSMSAPQDAEAFVKVLQSKVLKVVLPIWIHPHFAECKLEFVNSMISIMTHVYMGVEILNVNSNPGANLSGPLPDESVISLIVEMGFSRARAEEALRQVGSNSVEIATDWLFLHPEEPQEDDELARAVAMSLGNSDTSLKEDDVGNANNVDLEEEEAVQLPPVNEMLSACIKLLQVNEPLAFPIRDFFVMISSQNDGQHRQKVISCIIDHIKQCYTSAPLSETMLFALFHVLALVLHEDVMAREVASQAGLPKIALDLLSGLNLSSLDQDKPEVPSWLTACFLSIDQLLQMDPKMTSEIVNLEELKKDNLSLQNSIVIDENKMKGLQTSFGSTSGFLDIQDQKRLLEICCRCIQNQLPSGTMHVVLQLCSTLTKVHSIAVSFLDAGGLHGLLNLPTSSLFPGFNNVAAAIIRHILEDPNTLQQAMELEIRHSLIAASNRHSNVRVAPRTFVHNLAIVISRDPTVFLKAAQAVCRVEMIGDRPAIVLLKDREKEKSNAKDKEKKTMKDKSPASDAKTTGVEVFSVAPGGGQVKLSELSIKATKAHRKSPQSFTSVIEYLLDFIVKYIPPLEFDCDPDGVSGTPSLSDMDIDPISAKKKGKVVAEFSEDSKNASEETLASVARTAFIVKLLTEILLTYASSINVLLRRDAEFGSFHVSSRGLSGNSSGVVFHHILQNFLPYPGIGKKDKKTNRDWRHKLASRANQLLVASSVRSIEARRRIFSEINCVFNEFAESSGQCRAADFRLHGFIDLLNDILSARSPTGSYISAEASVSFIDVGLVRSLTRTLQVLDLDHADSPKIITGTIKVLELVTKEHVHSAYLNSAKEDNSLKLNSHEHQVGSSNDHGDRFGAVEMTSQPDNPELVPDQRENLNTVRASEASDAGLEGMHNVREMNEGFAHETEDDFMHEASEDGASLANGVSTVELRFDMPQNVEDDMGDEEEDEDMSGDEEVDEDDEENNDLEEDEVHQMSHPDTDHDDHVIDDEEFDEDVMEEEDDDDDDDDDGEILGLEEGINGINVFDHIEVLGGSTFPSETLRVMPLDIFGSRRQGRTTSIYNLLGRTGDHAAPHFEHPLLEQSPSVRHRVQHRQSETLVDIAFLDRNNENTSYRMDAIFRSLRNGRPGHRFNMWLDDNHRHGASSAPTLPEGIDELLVSHLRQPTPDQVSDQNIPTITPQEKQESGQLQVSESEVREETTASIAENNENMIVPSEEMDGSGNAGIGSTNSDSLQNISAVASSEQATEMQYERGDAVARDVEAVSQASSGSGATLGESLRSLEVEIGSVDGHDDGDRQGPMDRVPLGDLQPPARLRRSSGNAMPVSGRDTSLESVSEVPQHQNQGNDQSALHEPQSNRNVDADTIDPTFLEALPEELRAEVLSSRQNQVAQTSTEQPQTDEDIDPEFLAALPPDIREEVLAQQRAQRRQQSQELEGQPVEMDAVSIIATLPSEIREEVLLTSPDTLLATLTPALVAEANMLRDRVARRHHPSTFFGMNSRNRRGESSRLGETIGSTLERTVEAAARRSAIGKLIETDGVPLVDSDDLKAMIRLLRVVQPLYKGQLQKLLLNLSTHHETRTSLVKILMDMLMLDLRGYNLIDSTESPFRLYGCQSYIAYSRPQFCGGVPPLVSRRILEILTYLARHHPNVSKLLLHLELPCPHACSLEPLDQGHGKAVLMEEDKPEDKKRTFAIVSLLSLLSQPLYMRSVAHLEQLLNLVEVIIVNGESDSGLSNEPGAFPEQQSGPETTTQDGPVTADVVGSSGVQDNKSLKAEGSEKASTSGANKKNSITSILLSIPEGELRLLCSLLAHEGLSDNAYVLVPEVLKKMVSSTPSYCGLFITELANSVRSLCVCAINELKLCEDAEKALLRSSSANGTAILRVLQALSSLVVAVQEKDPNLLPGKHHHDSLSHALNINAALEPLWQELSNCINKIEVSSETPVDSVSILGSLAPTNTGVVTPLPAGAQNLLPYIESFFVTCEKLRPGQFEAVQDFGTTCNEIEVTTSAGGQKLPWTCTSTDEKHVVFDRFLDKHRKLLNSFIRQNPGLLEKSFSLMLKVPRFIDFDNKRAHFRSKIKHHNDHHHHSPVRISVRRAYLLEDSYNQLRMRLPQDLKGKLTVHFQGEEGIDAGGLTREWFQMLSRVIFDKSALLFTTVGNESTFQPNPNSVYQTEHLSYFKFVGRVVGKALFDGQLLDVHFTRSFYKHMLGVKVTYHDIEAVDPGYYKNLKWMLENDIKDVLDLTFTMDADEEKLILYERAEVTDCELIPGGRNVKVTEENKHEYVDRVAEHLLTNAIRPQINAFMEGFNELIPRDLISIFNDKELELLISGLPDIDLDDLRTNTEYSGYSNASPVIQWFWEVVRGFNKEAKARFLQFVTGTSKVPLEGFSALQGISGSQRFQIHKAYGSPHHLPSAHTCFNQLDMPEYTSKEQLQEKLLLAIHEANEGFGFG